MVHSVTKFLGGHSDLMAGAVVGSRAAILPAQQLANRMGLLAAPLDAWLAVRGIKTLQVRGLWCYFGEVWGRLCSGLLIPSKKVSRGMEH